jgi:hypothetical protein
LANPGISIEKTSDFDLFVATGRGISVGSDGFNNSAMYGAELSCVIVA